MYILINEGFHTKPEHYHISYLDKNKKYSTYGFTIIIKFILYVYIYKYFAFLNENLYYTT